MDKIIDIVEELNNKIELMDTYYLPLDQLSEFTFEEEFKITKEMIDRGINWITLDL